MRITATNVSAENKRYVPVPVGNGDLSLLIDYHGSMEQHEYSCNMVPQIWRAGVRSDSVGFPLVSMGYLLIKPQSQSETVSWSQTLDTNCAMTESMVTYADGSMTEAQTFCSLAANIIVMRRKFTGNAPFQLEYHLGTQRMRLKGNLQEGLDCHIDGLQQYHEKIYLFADRPVEYAAIEGGYRFIANGGEVTFFLAYGEADAARARRLGFDGLFAEHKVMWAEFYRESTPPEVSPKIAEVYSTAIYHLKISTTKWSIPVGLYATHWHGRYFGFDESFAVGGLMSAGHLQTALRVPEFRRNQLDAAQFRASTYFGKCDGSARYVWEAVEEPGLEGAPPGLWNDHIFHMAMIAQTAWEFYSFSHDLEYLRETGYPVIRGCAEFYRIQCVYRDGNKTFIGKCCDLERLGAARENAFMTTCGVIASFQAAANAAEILDLDHDMIIEWRHLAGELHRNLPNDGIKYVPYPGCNEKSIAIASGIYPFPVLSLEDPLLIGAINDFCENAHAAGNMYPVGNAVCAWYAAWLAIVFARLGDKKRAWELLEMTAEATGCFSEIFEIYETGNHPWFTTAEGCFVRAVNELSRTNARS